MEKQIAEIPVLQKIKEPISQAVTTSSCCSKPAGATACCIPSQSLSDNKGACCEQPEDGSACCAK